jgi:dTDP-glucose 4,6-dehydratase
VAIVLVTGGAGFIGREIVHQLFTAGHHIVVVDKGTYAARLDLLAPYRDRVRIINDDVRQLDFLHSADVVFHLAAESHVDNSITDASKFVESNIGGTYRLLELIRGQRPHDRPTLIHVSTDEVYGDVAPDVESIEEDVLQPSSPYSASKAAADMLVMAWQRTYDLKARIVRPSNCYGHSQYPEKLIPKAIRSWQLGKRMTIHGDGTQTRSWLAVEDCARALIAVWEKGQDGEVYNVPGNTETSVRSVVKRIQHLCAERDGGEYAAATLRGYNVPRFGCERPGGDRRYRVNGDRLRKLGWEPTGNLLRDLDGIVKLELELGVRV